MADRTEYMRELMRARRATDRTRRCCWCGDPYTPARSDSRYCSAAHKARGYRSRRTALHTFSAAGFTIPANEYNAGELRTCEHHDNGVFCPEVATVEKVSWSHHQSHLRSVFRSCDAHAPSRLDYSTSGPH